MIRRGSTRPTTIHHALTCVLGGVLVLHQPVRAQSEATSTDVTQGGVGEAGSRPVPRAPMMIKGGRNASQTPLSALLPIYFPATPPVLGAELPPAPAVRDPLWTELSSFTNEAFFAPLSTRLAQGDLNRRHRQRLDAYKADRNALLKELHERLASLGSDPTTRFSSLDALAKQQAPRLQELAATAEELRRELYRNSFLDDGSDWNEHRNWHLGEDDEKRTPRERLYDELSVLRAAIYYQEGLSSAQRHLLREIVIDLAAALGDTEKASSLESFEPDLTVFFLPHGSRVRLPAGLSADLSAEIGAFTAEKNALKHELRDALYSLDRASISKRERSLQELAARQEARLNALEATAERFRPRLMSSMGPVLPVLQTDWPPELATRIAAYLREKTELQKAVQSQTQDTTNNDAKSKSGRSQPPSREALAAFEEKNRARLAALTTEARAIREEVARISASRNGGNAGKSVDALLADFMTAYKHQQLQTLYRDYHTAVLEPGLSPAQRQLLFDAALAALDLTGIKDWQAVPE